MKDHIIDGVHRRMGFPNGFHVNPVGMASGLSLWRDDLMEVEIMYSSKHAIDARAIGVGEIRWSRVIRIYGMVYRGEKDQFWSWMNTFFKPTDIPCLCR
ncbi:hypothetical protein ACFX10_022956 [Malus domestica]